MTEGDAFRDGRYMPEKGAIQRGIKRQSQPSSHGVPSHGSFAAAFGWAYVPRTQPTRDQFMRRSLLFLAVLLVAPALGVHAQGTPSPVPAFDQYVARSVRDWRVPGLAIALVHGDTVTFAKGYGVRTIGHPEPINEHTVFAIGSTTKAMTAMLMGMLVDSGRVGWDDPVVRHMPDFRISDPYVTSQITIRDLLTHRAGLDNTDFLWSDTGTVYADILRRLPFVPLGYSMRSQFIYQNVMYATAGHVEALVSGKSWDELMRQRISYR